MAQIQNPDNAVVDYSTITALITTVNNLSDAVDSLNKKLKSTDPQGNVVSQIIDSNWVQLPKGATTISVTFGKTFTGKPNVVAIPMGGPKGMSVQIKDFASLTSSSVTLTTSVPADGSTRLYWIAVGNGSA